MISQVIGNGLMSARSVLLHTAGTNWCISKMRQLLGQSAYRFGSSHDKIVDLSVIVFVPGKFSKLSRLNMAAIANRYRADG